MDVIDAAKLMDVIDAAISATLKRNNGHTCCRRVTVAHAKKHVLFGVKIISNCIMVKYL